MGRFVNGSLGVIIIPGSTTHSIVKPISHQVGERCCPVEDRPLGAGDRHRPGALRGLCHTDMLVRCRFFDRKGWGSGQAAGRGAIRRASSLVCNSKQQQQAATSLSLSAHLHLDAALCSARTWLAPRGRVAHLQASLRSVSPSFYRRLLSRGLARETRCPKLICCCRCTLAGPSYVASEGLGLCLAVVFTA